MKQNEIVKQYAEEIRNLLTSAGMTPEQITQALALMDQEIIAFVSQYYLDKADEETKKKLDALPDDAPAEEIANLLGMQGELFVNLCIVRAKAYKENVEKNLPSISEKIKKTNTSQSSV